MSARDRPIRSAKSPMRTGGRLGVTPAQQSGNRTRPVRVWRREATRVEPVLLRHRGQIRTRVTRPSEMPRPRAAAGWSLAPDRRATRRRTAARPGTSSRIDSRNGDAWGAAARPASTNRTYAGGAGVVVADGRHCQAARSRLVRSHKGAGTSRVLVAGSRPRVRLSGATTRSDK